MSNFRTKTNILIFLILFLIPSVLFAQNKNFEQKLQWQSDKNASEYKVEVSPAAGGKSSFFTTTTTSITVNLSAGEYQYRVYAYDFLGRESSVSEWRKFSVLKAVAPEITAPQKLETQIESGKKVTVPVEVKNIEESSTVQLVNTQTKQTVQGTLQTKVDGGQVVAASAVFPNVEEGEWKVKVTNPSGLSSESAVIEIEDKARVEAEKKAEEEARAAEEKRLAEEQRLARAEEQKRLAEEKRLAQEAEKNQKEEEARLAAEQEKQRLAEEKRLAEEEKKRQAEEKQRLAEEKKRQEEEARLAEQQKKEQAARERQEAIAKRQAEAEERARLQKEQREAQEEQKRIRQEEAKKQAEERQLAAKEREEKAAAAEKAHKEAEEKAREEEKQREAEQKEKEKAEEEVRSAAEKEAKRLARLNRNYADVNIQLGGGAIFNLYDGQLFSYTENEIIPVAMANISYLPVDVGNMKFGLGFNAKLSYLNSSTEYVSYTLPFGLFNVDIVGHLPIVKNHLYIGAKIGAGLSLLNIKIVYNEQYSRTQKAADYYGYICAEGGVSLYWLVTKAVTIEAGADFDHMFITGMPTGNIFPYLMAGVRF